MNDSPFSWKEFYLVVRFRTLLLSFPLIKPIWCDRLKLIHSAEEWFHSEKKSQRKLYELDRRKEIEFLVLAQYIIGFWTSVNPVTNRVLVSSHAESFSTQRNAYLSISFVEGVYSGVGCVYSSLLMIRSKGFDGCKRNPTLMSMISRGGNQAQGVLHDTKLRELLVYLSIPTKAMRYRTLGYRSFFIA